MVTVPYYNDPHQQAYFDYLNFLSRREREREERKRQEEAGGGPLGAAAGGLGGALLGGLLAAPTGGMSVLAGAALGGSVGSQAGGAIGTGISPPGGPAGAARNQAWQQGIGTVADLGMTAATWRDMQAPHEAPGTAPSFLETYAAQQGRGGLGGLYQERRRAERQMGLLQERDRARQQYIDSMRGVGFEVVPSGRAIQGRYDELSAILKNEGNLSPSQQDQALSIAARKPLDMMVRRVEPTPEERWQKGTYVNPADQEGYTFTDRGGWKQITSNAENKLKQLKQDADQREADQKHILAAQKEAEMQLPDASPWEKEKRARDILDANARILQGAPQGPRPPLTSAQEMERADATAKAAVAAGRPEPEGMGWIDRAKLGMDIMRSMRADEPGQEAPVGPGRLLAQLDAMLEAESDVSKWSADDKARAEGMLETLFASFAEAKVAQGGKLTDPQKAIVRRLGELAEKL